MQGCPPQQNFWPSKKEDEYLRQTGHHQHDDDQRAPVRRNTVPGDAAKPARENQQAEEREQDREALGPSRPVSAGCSGLGE